MEALQVRTVDSPVGPLTLAGTNGRLKHLRMVDQTYEPSHQGWERDDAAFADAVAQLDAYFAGELLDFDLELNLIGIIVPCHRVIGANGSLTGYGGGLHRKKSLLEMEKNRIAPVATLFD
jgi:methylated-DNA-[protein]-cysteine S-methyltransferase